jgi:hypothetical protein
LVPVVADLRVIVSPFEMAGEALLKSEFDFGLRLDRSP